MLDADKDFVLRQVTRFAEALAQRLSGIPNRRAGEQLEAIEAVCLSLSGFHLKLVEVLPPDVIGLQLGEACRIEVVALASKARSEWLARQGLGNEADLWARRSALLFLEFSIAGGEIRQDLVEWVLRNTLDCAVSSRHRAAVGNLAITQMANEEH